MSMTKTKAWFENWFDTPYYHTLYKDRNDAEAHFFIRNIIDYLKIKPTHNVLDLACGKGRHSIYLNQKGLNVTGLDLSEQSIAFARQFQNERLQFAVHDMRAVYPQKFDFIFNLFTSFGYFENDVENQKAINAMHAMLKENGLLLIDFLNAEKTIQHLVAQEEKTIDDILFKLSRKVENGYIVKQINFEDKGKTYQFQERVKALNLHHFETFFAQAGLKIKALFGNYALEKFNESQSDRLIMLIVKD